MAAGGRGQKARGQSELHASWRVVPLPDLELQRQVWQPAARQAWQPAPLTFTPEPGGIIPNQTRLNPIKAKKNILEYLTLGNSRGA
jgi:hypothetical protein